MAKSRKRRIDFLRILAILFILASVTHFFLIVFKPQYLPYFLRPVVPHSSKNILIMGTDLVYDRITHKVISESGLTDTIILVRIDHLSQKLNMLSIPRDTPVDIPGYGTRKINMAHLIGNAELAKYVVTKLTGIHIDNYITISPFSLIKLVDLIGGIRMYVDKDMQYIDKAGHLYINLKRGWQVLDGAHAHDFLRYRLDPLGDINRVQRQQIFLRTLFNKLRKPEALIRIPWIIGIAREHIKTDLSMREILQLGNFVRCLRENDVRMLLFPGSFPEESEEVCYWYPDKEKIEEMLSEYFDKPKPGERKFLAARASNVSIFNNSGNPHLSWKLSKKLHEKYKLINVVMINRDDFDKTIIIAQKGDEGGARKLAKLLDIEEVTVSSVGDVLSDYTIILCKDWAQKVMPSPK